jgi:hypothetical protein
MAMKIINNNRRKWRNVSMWRNGVSAMASIINISQCQWRRESETGSKLKPEEAKKMKREEKLKYQPREENMKSEEKHRTESCIRRETVCMQNHLCCLSALHKMKLHAEAERPEGV